MTESARSNSAGRSESRHGKLRERFAKPTDRLVEEYTSSIDQDAALLRYDIAGSIAHARMLGRQGIIDAGDADRIVTGLRGILDDAEQGRFALRPDLEDVHMNIETELERRIGEAAGRLHTARSRNDQVITDFRLLVRDLANQIQSELVDLQAILVELAARYIDLIMPGYTHLQLAQPVLLAHYLMAYREMLHRDQGRFARVEESADECPLGSGALAGLPYPLDRSGVAQELGFTSITRNSMDAVSNRDFVIEFHAAASICIMHLSRLAEELILWSTREFGFIVIDDAFATGSSIMPQKKNPDVAELARGRTGSLYGALMAALTLMKGLPLTYNRDLQEDKAPLLSSAATLSATLAIFAAMLPTVTWNGGRMRSAAEAGYSLATDVADYLARKGLPFRQAHGIVGRLVAFAEKHGKSLGQLTLEEYRQFSGLFDEAVREITLETSVNSRDVPGGTARNQVEAQIAVARKSLDESRAGLSMRDRQGIRSTGREATHASGEQRSR